jgi:hypothetical protein
MNATASPRFTTRQTGWIALAVFGGWLVFLLLPSRPPPKPAVPDLPPVRAQSKLEAVGLRENVDWIGLPESFAVWADRILWDGDRVRFAYWHPGSRRYAYILEATRITEGIRFRALTGVEALSYERLAAELVADGAVSDTHPFLFLFEPAGSSTLVPPPQKPNPGIVPDAVPQAGVDLKVDPLVPPQPPVPESHGH